MPCWEARWPTEGDWDAGILSLTPDFLAPDPAAGVLAAAPERHGLRCAPCCGRAMGTEGSGGALSVYMKNLSQGFLVLSGTWPVLTHLHKSCTMQLRYLRTCAPSMRVLHGEATPCQFTAGITHTNKSLMHVTTPASGVRRDQSVSVHGLVIRVNALVEVTL